MARKDDLEINLVHQKLEMHIDQQDKDFLYLKNEISTIKNNHLEHISEDIEKLREKFVSLDKKLYLIFGSASIIAPVIYFLIQQYLK